MGKCSWSCLRESKAATLANVLSQFIKNLDIHFCTLLSPHMSWLILKKERQYTQISLYFIAAVESVESLGRAPDKVHFLHFGLLDLATSCCLEIGKDWNRHKDVQNGISINQI